MKKLFFIFILFLTVQTVVNAQSKGLSEEGYKHWIKAITRMEDIQKESDYELIIKEFKEVVKTDPDFPDVYFNMGVIYAKMGELGGGMPFFENAKASFEKYKELKPSEKAEVLKELARLEVKMEDYNINQANNLELQVKSSLILPMKINKYGNYKVRKFNDVYGNKLSRKEIYNKIKIVNPELAEKYRKSNNARIAGWWLTFMLNSPPIFIGMPVGLPIVISNTRNVKKSISDYNFQITNPIKEPPLVLKGRNVFKDNIWLYKEKVQEFMTDTDALTHIAVFSS